jgi:O-antigen/teichoic acid export membrane protein
LETTEEIVKRKDSSKQIIKSTGIVGGSQLIQIFLGIIRTKFVAVILGTYGVGIMGLYLTVIDLVRNVTSFGINFSGVRDIAEAKSSNDIEKISKSIVILRRWAIGTGFIGFIILIALCVPISNYTFNDSKYAVNIALLSITILLSSISLGQIAVLQAMQHISSMAKAVIWGALIGSIISIPAFYFWHVDGIVPSIVLMSIISLFISWMYVRKIKVERVSLTLKQSFSGGMNMAKFGFFIVVNSLVNTVVIYYLKSYIAKKMGFEDVGLYQAVLTITNTYLGVLLNSLLADYYPRLSAVNKDNNQINKIVNQQCEITLLLGGPLMILLLALSPVVISFLYSSLFIAAVPLLQWHIVGSFLIIVSWPVGVIYLGKGKGNYAFFTEMFLLGLYILCITIGWKKYGINIIGIAYCIKAIIGMLIVLFITKRMTGFKMSFKIWKISAVFALLILLCIGNILFNHGGLLISINCIICCVACIFTFATLRKVVDFKDIFNSFQKKFFLSN